MNLKWVAIKFALLTMLKKEKTHRQRWTKHHLSNGSSEPILSRLGSFKHFEIPFMKMQTIFLRWIQISLPHDTWSFQTNWASSQEFCSVLMLLLNCCVWLNVTNRWLFRLHMAFEYAIQLGINPHIPVEYVVSNELQSACGKTLCYQSNNQSIGRLSTQAKVTLYYSLFHI